MIELSERIGDHPEVAFEERQAAQWVSEVFERMGFRVEKPFAGLDTAFRARLVGNPSGPNIGFLVEYDALPEIGHACGHNTKGPSTWGAVEGILAALPELPGTVTVIGTPAEESGGGKIIMAENGAFHDLDVALAISIAPTNMSGLSTLAAQDLLVTFKGKSAHADVSPQDGGNAVAACIATFNLIDAARQQFTSDVRINGLIVEGGKPSAVGIIPERAVAAFHVACLDGSTHPQLFGRVKLCAQVAAQVMGCEVELDPARFFQEMRLNLALVKLIESKLEEIGLEASPPSIGGGTGATDLGNVSHIVPVDSIWIGIGEHLRPHTPEYREACRSEAGHRAIVNGARTGALCGLEILTRPQALDAIRRDFTT
jgi:amidohydrolase